MDNNTSGGKRGKNRPYLIYLQQKSALTKPRYDVFRDSMNAIYDIEGDMGRHTFSVRRDGSEVLVLRKKLAKLLPEYTIEKDGKQIASVKKGMLSSGYSGTADDKSVELRVGYEAESFDILVGGKKLCRIEKKKYGLNDRYEIMMFDGENEELAVALSVICDHISDKAEG